MPSTTDVPDLLTAALDTATVGVRLGTHLGAAGGQVVGCRVVRYRHRPGERCVVQYGVTVRDARGQVSEARVVGQWRYGRGDTAARARKLARRADGVPVTWTAPFPPVFFDEPTDMLATTYPWDRRLPGLAAAAAGSSPSLLGPMRAHLGLGAHAPLAVDVTCVRYREQLNAVLRYDVRAAGPAVDTSRGRFFVKVYGDGGGARLAAVHRALAQSGTGSRVGVAPAIASIETLGALVTAAAPGQPLDRVGLDRPRLASTLHAVATALADFAGLRVEHDVPLAHASTGGTARSVAAIAQALPDLAAPLAALARATAALSGEPPTGIVHGDLKLEHIFVDDARVHLIDLDSCHRGPAAWDLALLTERWWAARDATAHERPLAEWGAHVLGLAYWARVRPAGVAMPALRCAASLDVAAGLVKRREPDWQARATRLVVRAQRHLTLVGR